MAGEAQRAPMLSGEIKVTAEGADRVIFVFETDGAPVTIAMKPDDARKLVRAGAQALNPVMPRPYEALEVVRGMSVHEWSVMPGPRQETTAISFGFEAGGALTFTFLRKDAAAIRNALEDFPAG
jgi:hypothetical protein